MDSAERILVVDDEKTIRTVIAEALQVQGYQVWMAASGEEALRACQQTAFDLALVDLKMPGALDGLELLTQIHRRWPRMVIVMLTGYATLDSAIAALRQGAYDYLTKPANLAQIVESVERGLDRRRDDTRRQQLIAHLEATLRELKSESGLAPAESAAAERFVQTSTLTIDRQKRLVVCGAEPVPLTATEFDLLDYLACHMDRVVTAHELVKAIQGYDLIEADARPIIRVHIQRLRQKLEDDPEHPCHILNVRGKGYRFVK